MRKALFRGKSITDNNWWYGDYGYSDSLERSYIIGTMCQSVVRENTVGKHIGLIDINGKQVFTGDLVKHFNKIDIGLPEEYYIGQIIWDKEHLRYAIKDVSTNEIYTLHQNNTYEVVGNIFDGIKG